MTEALSASRWPVKTLHAGPPSRGSLPTLDAYENYVQPLNEYQPQREHIFIDRWHIGELVYPVTMGRPTVYQPGGFEHVEDCLRNQGAVVVRCYATFAERLGVFDKRGEDVDEVQMELDELMWQIAWETTLFEPIEVPMGYSTDAVPDILRAATEAEEEAEWNYI